MLKQDQFLVASKVYNLTIDDDHSGQRIDNFLFNKLKNVPKGRIYKMIRGGEVRVNKGRVSAFYKLQSNDIIRIPPYWAQESLSGDPGSNLIQLLLDSIIFEDAKVLVINKPSGIASHSGSQVDFGAIEILRAARDDLKNLELAHRLDRDTSGCLIFAKKRVALQELHQLIRDGDILKKYILLVKGRWTGGERIVDLPLLKNQLRSGERMVMVDDSGKRAITIFRPLKIGKEFSLLEAELKTGRTHQIRAHASNIGYPIAGDRKYGDAEFNSRMKDLGLKRLFLHADSITFDWEDEGKASFAAMLPVELNIILTDIFGEHFY